MDGCGVSRSVGNPGFCLPPNELKELLEEGIEQGIEQCAAKVVRRMKAKGKSPAQIAELTDLSLEEIARFLEVG